MPHPQMFEDDDPALAQVRHLALALPGAQEKVSHGRPAFFTTEVFAHYGGSRKVDGDWREHLQRLMVLLEEERSNVSAYLGPSGWLTAPVRLVREVDG